MSKNVKSFYFKLLCFFFHHILFFLFVFSKDIFRHKSLGGWRTCSEFTSESSAYLASIISPSWAAQLKWKKENQKPERQMTHRKEGWGCQESWKSHQRDVLPHLMQQVKCIKDVCCECLDWNQHVICDFMAPLVLKRLITKTSWFWFSQQSVQVPKVLKPKRN